MNAPYTPRQMAAEPKEENRKDNRKKKSREELAIEAFGELKMGPLAISVTFQGLAFVAAAPDRLWVRRARSAQRPRPSCWSVPF